MLIPGLRQVPTANTSVKHWTRVTGLLSLPTLQCQMHSTWDVEDKLDKEDKADKFRAEDVASARHLHNTCRTKCKDELDVATTVVFRPHPEGQ